jgi:hypothetical protein
MPPRFEDLHGRARDEARQGWYENVYWPWLRALADAVLADPEGCAAAFDRVHDTVPLPDPPRWGGGDRVRSGESRRPEASAERLARLVAERRRREESQRIREEQTLALALREAGRSVRQIAAELGVSKSTAHRRAGGGGSAGSRAAAIALLMVRAGDLEASLLRGGKSASTSAALTDLGRLREELRKLSGGAA